MGAWGPNAFQNDWALDWVGDLLESNNPSLISRVFEQVLTHDETKEKYFLCICIKRWQEQLPAALSAETLAAGEIVSAILGRPPKELPKAIKEWLDTKIWLPKTEVIEMARQAVAKIHTSSELKTFWEEGGGAHASPWHDAVADLERRLGQVANTPARLTDPNGAET
jgi:hypothetical protein